MCTNKKHAENLLHARGKFSGRIGYVLAVAGSAVGLGNIWRFPYLAAKYGGGMFLLVYLILMVTFGYVMIVSETALGRMTKKARLELPQIRKEPAVSPGRLDQRSHPDDDRSLLQCDRWLGSEISV